VSPVPTVANLAWASGSLPAYARLRRALTDPLAAQQAVLRRLVVANTHCAFGRAHGFVAIRHHADFVARVPLAGYDDFAPWIARLQRGESHVLTTEAVTRLVPTSGSTGARKLIPFTAALQREFNAAIGPWIVDLFRAQPALLGGAAYWSVTPCAPNVVDATSAVPVGFDDDAACLGGTRRRLVDAVMAVPSRVRAIADVAAFRRATLVALLRRRDLRLVSVWHPSFFTLLLDELARSWDELVREAGERRLARADPRDPRSIWPRLQLVSCWADGHAGLAADDLARRLPGVRMQAKGLLATEAFVTLPFEGAHPLAITSHFFEFLDAAGGVHLVDDLREGETYEVVVTTAGGLWRYRLGDQVVVESFVGRTPSLRFVGRVGGISDRRGEKLAEGFVAAVLRDQFAGREPPRFALLAPEEDESGCRYMLFVEGNVSATEADKLDVALRANPHYAWCRDLGQLQPPQVLRIAHDGYEVFAARAVERGQRLGDIKPVALSAESDWVGRFARGAATNGCETNSSRVTTSVCES
jgi:hypothetical protein